MLIKYSKASTSAQWKWWCEDMGFEGKKDRIMTEKDPRHSIMHMEKVAKITLSRCIIDWEKVSLGMDRYTAMRKQVF